MIFQGLDFDGEKIWNLQLDLGQNIMTWPQLYPIQGFDYKCNSGDSRTGKENDEMIRNRPSQFSLTTTY